MPGLRLTPVGSPLHPGKDRLRPRGSLLDENLSPRLKGGFDPAVLVVHARDLGENPGDSELWAYATEHALVLVTKDADFTDRVLSRNGPPPWVVRLHCGNLRAREMRLFLERHWPQIEALAARAPADPGVPRPHRGAGLSSGHSRATTKKAATTGRL